MTRRQRFEQFLVEYEALCRKYDLQVGACGCCESPWLQKGENLAKHIWHLRQNPPWDFTDDTGEDPDAEPPSRGITPEEFERLALQTHELAEGLRQFYENDSRRPEGL